MPVLPHPAVLLGLLVGLSTIVRSLIAWQHPTPVFFPDEIIYSALAREIAETGVPGFLGHSLDLPSVLTSYVTAPVWLLSDTTVAYHLVQSEGALAFSLAAIPVYLLARRLSLSTNASLLIAAGTLVLPDLALSSLLVSEPFAFLLFGFTFWAAHRALSPWAASATSCSFSVCWRCSASPALSSSSFRPPISSRCWRRDCSSGALRETLRAQLLVLVAFALPLPIAAAVGFTRVFGFYSSITDYLTPPPGDVRALAPAQSARVGPELRLVPRARSPARDRRGSSPSRATAAERTFALLLVPILLGQLAQAMIISAQVRDAQGRYLIYVLPLASDLVRARRPPRPAHPPPACRRPPGYSSRSLCVADSRAQPGEPEQRARSCSRGTSSNEWIGVPDTFAVIPFLFAGLAVAALFAWWRKSVPALVGLAALLSRRRLGRRGLRAAPARHRQAVGVPPTLRGPHTAGARWCSSSGAPRRASSP